LQSQVLAATTETGETSNISRTEALTRKALIALLALGAVVIMPKESSAYSLVTADSSGKIHVILDAQDKDGEVTPEISYDVPMEPGSQIGQVEVLADNRLVVAIANQDGGWDIDVLVFDGNSFDISGTLHFDPWVSPAGSIEITPDGNVLVLRSDGTYKFNPNDPQGSLEVLIDDDNLFSSSVSFEDGNGVQCSLVTSEQGGLQLIADGAGGPVITNYPVPDGMFGGYGITGIHLKGEQLVLSDGVRAYGTEFNPLSPSIDYGNFMLVDQAQVQNIQTAMHSGEGYVTLEGGGLMDFINNGNTARYTLDVGSNSGFVPYDSNQDGIDDTFFVRGGDNGVDNYSVTFVDGNSKDISRGIVGSFGANRGLAVIPDTIPDEIQAQFSSNTPINDIRWAVSPSVTVEDGGGGDTDMIVNVSADALLNEDVYFYFIGPHSVPGAPEPEENIAINVSSHTTLIVGHGTAGGLMLDQQSGDLDD
ncbi:MAG: hypothetical protein U0990_00195, partial [Candidatus Nanopelagicales bacterium]|nr:hypothetical protein [Candidatus Nanopelagicales bacterium]